MIRDSVCLIVGLGNPGPSYEKTRHNIGFKAVRSFAKAKGLKFRPLPSGKGEVALAELNGKRVVLLMPKTYMNSSGVAVKFCVDSFQVPLESILVIADDIYLPFGKLRLRDQGSAGGHNGLKSIESHLGTKQYARLRIGIGDRVSGELEDHVLGTFTKEEQAELPALIDEVLKAIDLWISPESKYKERE